ncbi:MAG: HD domain-containing protein [Myxococcota bacterium]|nr:HD domain-containing protein [Myxococcota bacterium]
MSERSQIAAWDQDRFLRAYRYASTAHKGQTMPDQERLPYCVHLSMVTMEICAALTVESVSDPDLAVQCACLHDVLEDTPTTRLQLENEFGTTVADGVVALTKDGSLNKADAMLDSVNRLLSQPLEVRAVKLADRITNMQTPPPHWSLEKRQAYAQEARMILEKLGSASAYLRRRLASKIDAYEANHCKAVPSAIN